MNATQATMTTRRTGRDWMDAVWNGWTGSTDVVNDYLCGACGANVLRAVPADMEEPAAVWCSHCQTLNRSAS